MKLSHSTSKLIILGLTLLAFGLRAYRLDVQSFWIDEGWTAHYTLMTPAELLHSMRTFRIIPPLYHFSTLYWAALFGDSEYSLRFYALIFGVLTIPLTYRLGQALVDQRLGLLAAFLMTISPYQIWHSQDARMYTILTAGSVMSMWGFVKLLPFLVHAWPKSAQPALASQAPHFWRWWWLYVGGTELALLTHYHALMMIGVQGLFMLFGWKRYWRGYLMWGITVLIILLPNILWIIFGSSLVLNYPHWVKQLPWWETYLRSAIAYSVGEFVPRPQAIVLSLTFVGLYGLGLFSAARRRWGDWRGSDMLAFLIFYTLAPNAAAWLYGQWRTPVYLERYLIPVQVGFLLTVALGILAIMDVTQSKHRSKESLPRTPALLPWWVSYLIGSIPLLLLISVCSWVQWQHYFNPAYAKDDWRAVIRTIENFGLPGDAVVFTGDGGEKLFRYYYHGQLPVYLDFLTPVPPPDQARQIIANIASGHQRVWFSPYGLEVDATLENWLAQHAYPAWHSWLGRKRLALYASGPASPDRVEMVNTAFSDSPGHGPTLNQLGLAKAPVAAGEVLPLILTWQTTTPLERDYQLSLRLVNGQGDIFGQSDWPPLAAAGGTSTWLPGQAITDRRGLWLPADLPPGRYALQLVVYDPASGQGLGQPLIIPNITVKPSLLTPPVTALAIPNPIHHSSLNLVGSAMPGQIQPGQEMWLWLYWQAPPAAGGPAAAIDADKVRITLDDGQNQLNAEFPLTDSVGPLDSWQPGQVRRAVYHVPTSPRLAGSQAQLKVSLLDAAGQITTESLVGAISLASRPRQFEAPPMSQPTNITFGQPPSLTLLGYNLPTSTVAANGQLAVTLFWQAEAEMDTAYTVFVQLLNSGGQVVAQVDQQPLAGVAPTTTWLPREILSDPYTLNLPPDLSAGKYHLITGLYNAATGQRLPLTAEGDFVELAPITVK
jgi:hypothetical protein